MKKYYAKLIKGSKVIYGECHDLDLLESWIRDNERIGFRLVGEIETIRMY